MKVIYRQVKCDDILYLGRHRQRNLHWRKVSPCHQKAQNMALSWCSTASCWGPGEELASEFERVTHEISGASKLQNNSTQIANALRSKAMTQFLRSAVKSCWAQLGLPLSCDNRMGLCISALAEAGGCWAIPVLVLDSCRDHDSGHLAWEMMDSTWLSPRNHGLSLAIFKQGP